MDHKEEFDELIPAPAVSTEPDIPEEIPAEAVAEEPVEAPAADPIPGETSAAPDYAGWNQVPERKAPKKSGAPGRKIAACAAVLALLAASCAATAWHVNRRWEKETAAMAADFQSRLDSLEGRVENLSRNPVNPGTSGPNLPAQTGDALNPSQVYAMNVNSVVAISNQSTTNVWGQVSETASSGTGFILSADGYIVSNYHVVEGATRLTVITYMGDEYEARTVGFDAMNDVAILKIETEGLDPVQIGDSDALIVGDQVVAIGNPLGELTSSLTVGYISAKDRTINTDGNLINMMQTDAAINSGNSGGPLFNMYGQVVGITTAKYSGSTASGASIEGIGFAIPINDMVNMYQDLVEHGYRTNQAYLGVSVMDLPAATAGRYGLPGGSYVRDVTAGSCAEKAGLLPKDIIIAVGEYGVQGNTTLSAALRNFSAGDSTTITVWRDSTGEKVELAITFDERPQDPDADQAPDPELPGEMPAEGSFQEWYNYFAPFFGHGDH